MKLKYIAILVAVALTSLTSCKDFLDKVPDTRVYLNNVEQLRQLMVDGYMASSYACVAELSSDNVIDNNSPSDDGVIYNLSAYDISDNQLYAWQDVDLASGNDTPSGVWSGCYGAIAVCNAVLEKALEWEQTGVNGDGVKLSAQDMDVLKAVKGEALVSRAFHHWILCNIFCMPYAGPEKSKQFQGIPYTTVPEKVVHPHYERGTLAEDYEKIEKDLMEGLPLINDQIYEVPKYHFNLASANAFAARFFLYKREYDKAVKYATASFKGNDPSTMMNDIWSNSSFYYISDIGRYNTSVKNASVMMCFTNYTTWWRRFLGQRYTPNRDAKRATIEGPGPTWNSCRYINNRTKETFAMHPCFFSVCGSAGGQEYGSYYAGNMFEQFEYTDKLAGIGYCHGIRAEFTTEQSLLTRAEANLFLGNIDEAFADLKIWDVARQKNVAGDDRMIELTKDVIVKYYNKDNDPGFGIMKDIHIDEVCPSEKYHVTPEILPFLQCVQHFRRIETVHTGQRWFDIKRFGLEIPRKIGPTGEDLLTVHDLRKAIQIPNEVLSAGLEGNIRDNAPKSTNKEGEARIANGVITRTN